MSESITLRSIEAADRAFLYRVYGSTREEELAAVDWDAAQKSAFLEMQFTAQHQYYHSQFPDAAFQVILSGDQPIGRLYVDRTVNELHILDIALLPEHRNRGIGSSLLNGLLAEADDAGKRVRIYVEKYNPALRLYQRLGFVPTGEHGIHWQLERLPKCSPVAPPEASQVALALADGSVG